MSPTVTAFLLSCMCFASINISVTNAEFKLDLVFLIDPSYHVFEIETSITLVKQVAAEAEILIGDVENFKAAVVYAKNPTVIVVPLAQYNQTEFEPAVEDTIVRNGFSDNIANSLVTVKNISEASEISGATSCGSLQVLVLIITDEIDPSEYAEFMTNTQLIRDAGIVSIAVGISVDDLRFLQLLASGDPSSDERVYSIGSDSDLHPTIDGINTDIRRAVQAVSCPCDSDPCMNGGTCSNIGRTGNYWCDCVGMFIGKNCEFCI